MSRRYRTVPLIAVFSLCATVAAFAQEPRTTALVMGYPTTVGVLWHMTEGIALRPDFAISAREKSLTRPNLLIPLVGGLLLVSARLGARGWNVLRRRLLVLRKLRIRLVAHALFLHPEAARETLRREPGRDPGSRVPG